MSIEGVNENGTYEAEGLACLPLAWNDLLPYQDLIDMRFMAGNVKPDPGI